MSDDVTPMSASGAGVVAGRDATLIGEYVAGRDLIIQSPTYPRLAYRREIGQLIAFYIEVFVGREAEFRRIESFAAQLEPGYLLVEAPPGYGKSALVAQLVRRCEARKWQAGPAPNLVYFFVREEGGRHTPEAFCSAVNSQLLDLLGEPGGGAGRIGITAQSAAVAVAAGGGGR
jgi:hypothetical protein